jgi:multiple sugar transport system substrate-binding protein
MHRRTLPFLALSWLAIGCLAASCLTLAGCGGPPAADVKKQAEKDDTAKPTGQPLRLAVIDDVQLSAAIRELAAEWQARAGDPLEVIDLAPDKLDQLDVDAVLYPTYLLGPLVDRGLLASMPPAWRNSPGLAWDDLFEIPRQREASYGEGTLYGIPLGSPTLVVFYRADLLTPAKLEPPADWTAYQTIAERFAKQPAGSIEPLGKGWAGVTLLARATSYAKHPDNFSDVFDVESMRPLIDGPPFVQALEELAVAYRTGPPEQLDWTPADVRREFLAGRAALALTWPAPGKLPKADGVELGVAEIPAGEKVYDIAKGNWHDRNNAAPTLLLSVSGRLGSVTAKTTRGVAARELIAALSRDTWGSQLGRSSPELTLGRRSQGADAESWIMLGSGASAARQYAQVLADRGREHPWMFCLRIPGRSEYLAALDTAVRDVCAGKAEPAAALSTAADTWREVTEKLGKEAQQKAYRRSLGLAP